MKAVLFLLASTVCAAAQSPDYRAQRDFAIDATAQCYGLWSARNVDTQSQLRDAMGKVADLEKKLASAAQNDDATVNGLRAHIAELERQLAATKGTAPAEKP